MKKKKDEYKELGFWAELFIQVAPLFLIGGLIVFIFWIAEL